MLISHRYRFIYTKTAKTAGTSVESYFERFCMPEGEWQQLHAREAYESSTGVIGYRGPDTAKVPKWYNHMSAALIREQIGADTWNRYFKFCVVRNPFEKAISAFAHFARNYSIPADEAGLSFRREHPLFTEEQRRFLHWLSLVGPPIDRDKYLIGSVFCLDDVMRYEALQDEVPRLCKRIGVPWNVSMLPQFKADIRDTRCTVTALYTPPAVRLVETAYEYEMKTFGYTSPVSHKHHVAIA